MRVQFGLVTLVAASLAAASALADQSQKGCSAKMSMMSSHATTAAAFPFASSNATRTFGHFAKMDSNHDGIVSENEFIAAHRDMASRWATATFEKLGGMEISQDQFMQTRTDWEREFGWMPILTPSDDFASIDINDNGKVGQYEFVYYWVNRATDHAQVAFAELGGSKDRGLTFAQYESGLKNLERSFVAHLTGLQMTR